MSDVAAFGPLSPIGDGASAISRTPSIEGTSPDADPSGGVPFASLLKQAVVEANQSQELASRMSADFSAGRSDDIHGTMIASKQAEIELHLVATVKNKVVDAINDLLRMSI